MGNTRNVIRKWLRIILPELQLKDLIEERGFIAGKKEEIPQTTVSKVERVESAKVEHLRGSRGTSTGANKSATAASVAASASSASSTASATRAGATRGSTATRATKVRTARRTPGASSKKKELSSLHQNLSARELDGIFAKIEARLNQTVYEQTDFVHELVTAYKTAYIANEIHRVQHAIMLTGPAGTGKRTALQALVEALYEEDLTCADNFIELDVSRYNGENGIHLFESDCAASLQDGRGTLVFSGVERASSDMLATIVAFLTDGYVRTAEGTRIDAAGYFLVFYIDHAAVEETVQGQVPTSLVKFYPAGILQRIRATAVTAPLSEVAMTRIVRQSMSEALSRLSEQTQVEISIQPIVYTALVDIAMQRGTYGEAVDEWISDRLSSVILDLRARNQMQAGDKVQIIHVADEGFAIQTPLGQIPIQLRELIQEERLEDLLVELEQLVGLQVVKQFIYELMETVRNQQRRIAQGASSVPMSLHMIFSGNPGTGKTTVARLISRILKAMGLLRTGQLVETTRQDLVGEYVGTTAPKTFAKVQEALGGVLFIDEAYTLSRHRQDMYGQEAIDTIVKSMEDQRGDFVVILAGYTKEMERFLQTNSGLRSRFPFIVEFPDYTPQEMLDILHGMAAAKDYKIAEGASDGLLDLFSKRQIPGRDDGGNGRLVRNIFEEAIRKQAMRLSAGTSMQGLPDGSAGSASSGLENGRSAGSASAQGLPDGSAGSASSGQENGRSAGSASAQGLPDGSAGSASSGQENGRSAGSKIGSEAISQSGEGDIHQWNVLQSIDFGIGERTAFNIEAELSGIVGLDNVKSFLRTLEKQIIVDQRRKEAGITVMTGQSLNMIFSGNPGTGKTTMARIVAHMLQAMGYLKKGHLIEADRSDLVADYVGQTAGKTTRLVERALGGVLFIDEAYALGDQGGTGYGKEAVDTLVRLMDLHKDHLVVILAGYTKEMQGFLRINPGLQSRFPLQIEFPDYTSDELGMIAEMMVKSRGFSLQHGLQQALTTYLEAKIDPNSNQQDMGNARMVRNLVEDALRHQAMRLVEQPDLPAEELTVLTIEDFQLPDETSAEHHQAMAELEQIIGLESVKQFVRTISAQIEVSKRREALGLPVASAQTLHMIFKGNPGTGKTTIARIMARRLYELGVVKREDIVETDRSGLVAGYAGQTAMKTRRVIEDALGGVLFVDEAYALAADNDQYGREAIDTLVKAMDDYRDRLVVILAGYDEDMEQFLDSNPGLRSRFPNIIRFPDYTADEMLRIALAMLEKQGYVFSAEAEEQLLNVLQHYEGDAEAGNGRLVRNLIEQALRRHALRVSQMADAGMTELTTLLPEDIRMDGEEAAN